MGLLRSSLSVCMSVLAIVALFLVLTKEDATKQVNLIVNGHSTFVETTSANVKQLLSEFEIEMSGRDIVKPSINHMIQQGDTIQVRHAVAVQLSVDGEHTVKYTTKDTVAQALVDWKVTLGKEDRVEPNFYASIQPAMNIKVVRVQTVFDEVEEILPYQVVEKHDNSLLVGKKQTVQEGQQGLLVKSIKKTLEDGIVVSEEVVDETIAQEALNEVVAVGSRKPVTILSAQTPDVQQITKKGITFGVKRILDQVTLTAYDAGIESTGKTEDHPHYGMTYTDTVVKEGRTVAVDPKVIPLGWWVYIEGIGFRRAEDIGSAVKGKKIDIYMDSHSAAKQFGLKRGYTVYIIGPNKPQES